MSTWTKTKPNQSEPIWSDREGKQSNNNIDEKKTPNNKQQQHIK